MINGAPNGTLGLASSSGWMTSELFPRVMEHFIKHTNSSKENPSLLITDNHESHMCIEVLDLAKNAGVTMLTLPPHCSHKMQPLDLSVFGPFKSYYNTSVDSWLLRNPGRTMTIYQIAECVGESFLRACTPSNITAGFRRSGIHPLDIDIFDESDFIMSEVSNRPDETRPNCQINETEQVAEGSSNEAQRGNEAGTTSQCYVSPEQFRGYPKAPPRKTSGRVKGRSIILTSTPEKAAIEEKALNKRMKNKNAESSVSRKKLNFNRKRKSNESEGNSDGGRSDESCAEEATSEDENSCDAPQLDLVNLKRNPISGDFILVKFPNDVYYVAKVLQPKDKDGDYEVSYLRKSEKIGGFVTPQIEDVASANCKDIAMILPPPLPMATKRLERYKKFSVNFGHLNVH